MTALLEHFPKIFSGSILVEYSLYYFAWISAFQNVLGQDFPDFVRGILGLPDINRCSLSPPVLPLRGVGDSVIK